MGRRHEQTFQMTNKQVKRCSTFLDFGELQFETTVRYDHIPVRIAKVRKKMTMTIANAGQGMWGNLISHILLMGT